MITVLAGGVGASRFLQGLVQVEDPATIAVVSNTGDDVDMFGLHVSPDVDIVIYALAGAVNPETGWGLDGDTLHVVEALQRYGYGDWFKLGDRDLATAIHRSRLMREGMPMHEIVADIASAWDVGVAMYPMSNQRVQTQIVGPDGIIPFQDYMVRLRTEVEVQGVEFQGANVAVPAPGVLESFAQSEMILLAPSNPFVSIGPILGLPGVREGIQRSPAIKAAISPIVAGQVVKGPAGRMLESMGHEVSALGVARLYAGLVDLMVIDDQDRDLAPAIEHLGMACHVTDTMMTGDERKAELAASTVGAARRLLATRG